MDPTLTRADILEQLERYLGGSLNQNALAAWAFKQFADEEEELLVYEPGCEDVISEVLDELMWADAAPFALDPATAQALAERLK